MCHAPLIRTLILTLAASGMVAGALVAAEKPASPVTSSPKRAATTRASTGPARHPFAADDPTPQTRQQTEVRKLFDFLMSEYARLLDKSRDRVSRSLIIVCMSRIGRDDATERILGLLETERDLLVRMTAWQAMLARANQVNAQQHKRWVTATAALIRADAFRGDLKLAAAQLLATAAPDRSTKDAWRSLFSKTDSRKPEDAPAIEVLGEALANWHSPDLVEWLLGRSLEPADAVRADRVLRRAGSTAGALPDTAGAELRKAAREASGEHRKWWTDQKPKWEELRAPTEEAWRTLRPQFLASPQPLDAVNPLDKDWRNDLELQAPDLRAFDVGFVVDATGSMTPVLEWLKRDVAKMLQAFGTVALEPRIGLTFYRDQGDRFLVQTKSLTGRVPDLLNVLSEMTAEGGGDIPEAVFDGLEDSLKKNPWTQQTKARKVLVLIGDAPPKPGSEAACVELAKDSARRGFRVYAVKCRMGTDALESFDAIAAAGRGEALAVEMTELMGAMTGRTYERLAEALRAAEARAADKRATSPAAPPATAPSPAKADRITDWSTGAGSGAGGASPSGLPATKPATAASALPAPAPVPVPAPAAADLQSLFDDLASRRASRDSRPVGHRLLSRVLIDVINPQFKDRIDPMVSILWEMLESNERETAQDDTRSRTRPGSNRGRGIRL